MEDRAAASSPSRAPRTRILVVEDDVALARVLVRSLTREGFEVATAHDGIVAGESLMTQRFDVVMSDVNLPGASGVDLVRLVRAHDLDVPILLFTGEPAVEMAQRAVELGALTYLTKPVATDVLVAALRRAARIGRLARVKREAAALAKGRGLPTGDRAGLIVAFERALEGLRVELAPVVDARSLDVRARSASLVSAEPVLPSASHVRDAAERLGATPHLERRVRELAAVELARSAGGGDLLLPVSLPELEANAAGIAASPLAPHAARIVLQISERAEIGSVHALARAVRVLRDAGFRFGVAEVGAGEGGLVRFATLEPDVIHLDPLLVRDADQSFARRRVLGELADACHDLGARIVCGGIATRSELSCARAFGCDLLEGELFSRGTPRA